MKNLFFIFVIVFSYSALAGLNGNYSLKSSKISYHMKYLLKKIEGTSSESKGLAKCESNSCQFIVAFS
ncbi:MAG: hypothetical protein H6622_11810 [Halobacteriovoraceae bacterium]|nr:hypothetical protein [Halobacteriovoraceae bacterium]